MAKLKEKTDSYQNTQGIIVWRRCLFVQRTHWRAPRVLQTIINSQTRGLYHFFFKSPGNLIHFAVPECHSQCTTSVLHNRMCIPACAEGRPEYKWHLNRCRCSSAAVLSWGASSKARMSQSPLGTPRCAACGFYLFVSGGVRGRVRKVWGTGRTSGNMRRRESGLLLLLGLAPCGSCSAWLAVPTQASLPPVFPQRVWQQMRKQSRWVRVQAWCIKVQGEGQTNKVHAKVWSPTRVCPNEPPNRSSVFQRAADWQPVTHKYLSPAEFTEWSQPQHDADVAQGRARFASSLSPNWNNCIMCVTFPKQTLTRSGKPPANFHV